MKNPSPDHCDICDRPQWVLPNGEHRCRSIEELQHQYQKDTELILRLHRRIAELGSELQSLKEATDKRNRNE